MSRLPDSTQQPAQLDPKRLGTLVNRFSAAFFSTPESDDLVGRTQETLKALPDDVVRELGEAMEVLAALAKERLGEPKSADEGRTDPA